MVTKILENNVLIVQKMYENVVLHAEMVLKKILNNVIMEHEMELMVSVMNSVYL
jgi:hypothetical protein